MMTAEQISPALDALVAALAAKGFHNPDATLFIRDMGQYGTNTILASYKLSAYGMSETFVANCDKDEDLAVAFNKARDMVNDLESVEDANRRAFFKRISDLKADAEREGYDVALPLLNNLVEQVANNLLPPPPVVAAE